ncbi:MAG: trypsin-like peptidase domain-containing protein, partial [Pseudomonadota bacterium]
MASNSAHAKPIVVQAPQGAPMSFADLIEKVSPAVVSVAVVTEVEGSDAEELMQRFRGVPGFEDFMERYGAPENQDSEDDENRRRGRSVGSGFFISAEGHIVTNNHVVEDAKEVTIALKDGTELEAEVIGTDPQSDLAVLKVDDGDHPYVKFSDLKPPRVGDWVVAVGNPFNLGGTATAGIVSAVGREIGGPYTDFIQIDAPINRGNSGGPTFDLRGEVVGVNTAIFSPSGGSVGIGFAIEAAAAKQIVSALIETGEVSRGWLGVSIQTVTEEIAESQDLADARGAIVNEVVDDSPAEAGGFKRGDIILAVNGDKVDSSRDVTRRVGGLLAGTTNTFKVLREGRQRDINVTIGKRPGDLQVASVDPQPWSPEEKKGVSFLGAELRQLDQETRTALGLK